MSLILAEALGLTASDTALVNAGYPRLAVMIGLFVLAFVVLGLVFSFLFYRKRLEHKRTMAAIEKGTSLSEIAPAKPAGRVWIKSLTVGIALLIVAIGFLVLVIGAHLRFQQAGYDRSINLVMVLSYLIAVPLWPLVFPWLFAASCSERPKGGLWQSRKASPCRRLNALAP